MPVRLDRCWLVMAAALVAAASSCRFPPGIRAPEAPPPPENEDIDPEEFDPEVRRITPQLLARENQTAGRLGDADGRRQRGDLTTGYAYRVGVGDVLNVIVWEHPELTNPAGVIMGGLEDQGRLVGEDGAFFFPFVGRVEAAGRSIEEIRRDISDGLETYIDDPQVDVRVAEFRSQRVYVTGEVAEPGPVPVNDRPMTVLDAIGRAGGLLDSADRRRAYLTRDDGQRRVDLAWLYETGGTDEVLRDGDVLHVPDDHFDQVIVMGEVLSQTRVPLHRGRLSLAEAIAEAEGIELTTADTSRIVVVRGEPVHSEQGAVEGVRPIVYVLDGRQASDLLLAEGFQLEPRDIVFIPAAGAVRINRMIDQILPQVVSTVQAVWMTDRLIRD